MKIKTIKIVSLETGEVLEEPGIFVPDHQKKEVKRKQAAKKEQEDQGGFIWMRYEVGKIDKSHWNRRADLTRLIMLATYLNYDNVLTYNKQPMTKVKMMEILKLPQRTFFRFFENEVKLQNILQGQDGSYSINKKFAYKGRLDVQETGNTRVYIDYMRKLYNKTQPKEHYKISYLFLLLPYVNIKYNIICSNPLETDESMVDPLSDYKIREILNCKRSAENFNKIMDGLIIDKKISNQLYRGCY